MSTVEELQAQLAAFKAKATSFVAAKKKESDEAAKKIADLEALWEAEMDKHGKAQADNRLLQKELDAIKAKVSDDSAVNEDSSAFAALKEASEKWASEKDGMTDKLKRMVVMHRKTLDELAALKEVHARGEGAQSGQNTEAKADSEAAVYKERISALETELTASRKAHMDLEARHADFVRDNESAKAKAKDMLVALRDELKVAKSAQEQESEARDALEAKVTALENEKAKWSGDEAHIHGELTKLRQLVHDLQDDKDKMESAILEMETKEKQLNAERKNIQAALDDSQGEGAKRVKSVEAALEKKTIRVAELEAKMTKIEGVLSAGTQAMKKTKESLKASEDEVKTLKAELAAVKVASAKSLETAQEKLAAAEEALAKLTAEVQTAKKESEEQVKNESNAAVEDLEEKLRVVSAELASLKEERKDEEQKKKEDKDEAFGALIKEKEELGEAHSRQAQEIERLSASVASLEQQVQLHKQLAASLQDAKQEVEDELVRANGEIESLTAEKKDLTEAASRWDKERSKLAADNEKMRQSLKQGKEGVAKLVARITELEEKEKEVGKTEETFRGMIRELEGDKRDLQAAVDALETRVSAFETGEKMAKKEEEEARKKEEADEEEGKAALAESEKRVLALKAQAQELTEKLANSEASWAAKVEDSRKALEAEWQGKLDEMRRACEKELKDMKKKNKTSNKELNKALTATKTELAKVREQLVEAEANFSALTDANVELTETVSSLSGQLEGESNTFRNDRVKLEAEVDRLTAELQAKTDSFATAKAALQKRVSEAEDRRQQSAQHLEEIKNEQKQKIRALKRELEKKEDDLQHLQTTQQERGEQAVAEAASKAQQEALRCVEEKQEELDAARLQTEQVKTKLTETEASLGLLKSQAKEELAACQAKASADVAAMRASHQREIESWRGRWQEIESERKHHASLQRELEAARQQVQQIAEKRQAAKKQAVSAVKQLNELQTEYAQLKATRDLDKSAASYQINQLSRLVVGTGGSLPEELLLSSPVRRLASASSVSPLSPASSSASVSIKPFLLSPPPQERDKLKAVLVAKAKAEMTEDPSDADKNRKEKEIETETETEKEKEMELGVKDVTVSTLVVSGSRPAVSSPAAVSEADSFILALQQISDVIGAEVEQLRGVCGVGRHGAEGGVEAASADKDLVWSVNQQQQVTELCDSVTENVTHFITCVAETLQYHQSIQTALEKYCGLDYAAILGSDTDGERERERERGAGEGKKGKGGKKKHPVESDGVGDGSDARLGLVVDEDENGEDGGMREITVDHVRGDGGRLGGVYECLAGWRLVGRGATTVLRSFGSYVVQTVQDLSSNAIRPGGNRGHLNVNTTSSLLHSGRNGSRGPLRSLRSGGRPTAAYARVPAVEADAPSP